MDIIEKVARALCRLRVNNDDYVDEQWPCFTHDAKAAIVALADSDLDEKAFAAAVIDVNKFAAKASIVNSFRAGIRGYLNTLKEQS